MTREKINYPEYVKADLHEVLFRFLSVLADHYDKNHFWIRGQHALYRKKFKNIPTKYIEIAFTDYLMDEMKWLPTVGQVGEYVFSRRDFQQHWRSVPLGKTFCQHCRTDDDGKTGGYRQVFFYGWRESMGKVAEAHYKGKCDCELGQDMRGASYQELMEWMKDQDPTGEVTVSYFDPTYGRIVTAQEQSNRYWQKKVDSGVLRLGQAENGEEQDKLLPNWEHPIWTSIFGGMMAESYGFEMPEHIKAVYETSVVEDDKQKVRIKREKHRRLKEKIGGDPFKYRTPTSLADIFKGQRK